MPEETPVCPVCSSSDGHKEARESVTEALRRGAAVLAAAGIESPLREARLLLGAALGLRREDLLRERAAEVPVAGYDRMLARRAAREPLALITGHREFWSLDFLVSPATLIPRADSEALVEAALAALPERGAVRRVLDLGTGTGCLLLAALTEFPAAWGLGIDRNPAAAALALGNARRLGLADRAAMIAADWAAPLAGRFDLVLSNPPYIRHDEIARLMPEVARFEPAGALDGGADGLDAYRRIAAMLPGLLAPAGAAVLELGQGQADAVSTIAAAAGLAVQGLRHDLSGTPRALVLAQNAMKKPFGIGGPGR
jgi:release factor glutamine methyltransferase